MRGPKRGTTNAALVETTLPSQGHVGRVIGPPHSRSWWLSMVSFENCFLCAWTSHAISSCLDIVCYLFFVVYIYHSFIFYLLFGFAGSVISQGGWSQCVILFTYRGIGFGSVCLGSVYPSSSQESLWFPFAVLRAAQVPSARAWFTCRSTSCTGRCFWLCELGAFPPFLPWTRKNYLLPEELTCKSMWLDISSVEKF